jgi:hypothetical protein
MIKSAMDDLQLQRPLIPNVPADDPQFIELVSRAVAGEPEAKTVHGLFVIRIDNWFDHKWLNFSGIGRVAFGQYMGTWFDRDTALDEFHQQGAKSTFPPFTPNRVITQDFYRKGENGAYVLDENGPWVHSSARERSSANLDKRIITHNNSCLFVWFSSSTLANRRGSLMIYRANGRIIGSWYSSFSCDVDWGLVRTEGISRQHLAGWLAPSPISPIARR